MDIEDVMDKAVDGTAKDIIEEATEGLADYMNSRGTDTHLQRGIYSNSARRVVAGARGLRLWISHLDNTLAHCLKDGEL